MAANRGKTVGHVWSSQPGRFNVVRKPNTKLRRIPMHVDGTAIDADEAKRRLGIRGARYLGLFRCWHTFEVAA